MPDGVVQEGLGIYHGLTELIGIYALFAFLWAFFTSEGPVVSILGLTVPKDLLIVLCGCHFITVPWALFQYVNRVKDWFLKTEFWLSVITASMAVVENYYRDGNPIVICICLFTSIAAIMGMGMAYYGVRPRFTTSDTVANALCLVPWFMGAAMAPDAPTLGIYVLTALLWAYAVYGAHKGPEPRQVACVLTRPVDAFIWAFVGLNTGNPIMLAFAAMNVVAFLMAFR